MIRKQFNRPGNVTIRAAEMFRIEALSDAVFAFSVSLLIMSLEVPGTFEELKHTLRQFFPFMATVSLVFFFWYQQNNYFRQYGLHDTRVILLNLGLLILILFYVFPLKFLFMLLLSMFSGINYFEQEAAAGKTVLFEKDFPTLILFFSAGYALIWLIFYQLYQHAWKRRAGLHLSAEESILLRSSRRDALIQVFIACAAAGAAQLALPVASGFVFLLIPFWLLVNNFITKRQLRDAAYRK
jgi:uncharacterized membrane protein